MSAPSERALTVEVSSTTAGDSVTSTWVPAPEPPEPEAAMTMVSPAYSACTATPVNVRPLTVTGGSPASRSPPWVIRAPAPMAASTVRVRVTTETAMPMPTSPGWNATDPATATCGPDASGVHRQVLARA